jgi:hypothetical protein
MIADDQPTRFDEAARFDEPAAFDDPSQFDELDEFPEALLTVPAESIKRVLSRPTLIHLSGEQPSRLMVTILLHGNEDVGLKAVQQVLAGYRRRLLPRDLSIFVGNVEAAAAGVRYLPHQPDFNRVWPGSEMHETPEHALMRGVVARMVEKKVAATIDLHNNSGRNPYYACICSLNVEHLRLGALFSPTVLYFQRPKGVQTQAFAQFCPSITCECGAIGDAGGVQAAVDLLERALQQTTISNAPYDPASDAALWRDAQNAEHAEDDHPLRLFHTLATWRIAPWASLSFAPQAQADVVLRPDLDRWNFVWLPAGETLGAVAPNWLNHIEVRDESGRLVTEEYFECDGGNLRLRRSVLPSMLSCSIDAVRKDCVGYFMERYPLGKLLSSGSGEPSN